MYLTIKILIDYNEIDEDLFHAYEKVFSDEVKRIAVLLKGNEIKEAKKISYQIHYRSKLHVLSEAKRVSKLKFVNENYLVSPIWNPESYTYKNEKLRLHFGLQFKKPYMDIKLRIRDYQKKQLEEGVWRSIKIRKVGDYHYVYLILLVADVKKVVSNVAMGVDLGIRVPAVCATSNGKVKFVGNGRYIRFLERSVWAKYKKLDKAKRKDKIKKMDHKLARMKFHLNHTYSRMIINFAKTHNVSVIKLERLKGLQERLVKEKNTKNFHWSYYQMQSFIKQKAKQEGIQVVYINPRYTSRICPNCGKYNKPYGRTYTCICGYRKHRDLVGAINILNAT